MKQTFWIMLAVGLLVGGAQGMALASGGDAAAALEGSQDMGAVVPSYPPDYNRVMDTTQPGWVHMGRQATLTVTGTITNIDFDHRTLTLNDGESFTLPASLEYSSLPTIGQAVEVTFAEQNGQKMIRWIDLDDARHSHGKS